MNLFDPFDCRVARDLIAQGNDLDAVRLLGRSADREHRVARKLMADAQPRLIAQADQAAAAALWDRAIELFDAAALCCELPVAAVASRERVLSEQRRAHEQARRVEQALGWADQGRVVSALDLLRPLADHDLATGQDARADLEERLSRGERYLDEADSLLDQGLVAAAKERLDRARETHAHHPRLAALEDRARRVQLEQAPLPVMLDHGSANTSQSPLGFLPPLGGEGRGGGPMCEGRPMFNPPPSLTLPAEGREPEQAGEVFVEGWPGLERLRETPGLPSQSLSPVPATLPPKMKSAMPDPNHSGDGRTRRPSYGLQPDRFLVHEELLVITGEEAVIGNARGRGVTIPLLANVHSRHALIVRHRGDYQLVALPDCATLLNGVALIGTKSLADGDVIQFGPPGCQWRYLRPVAHSATAIFESVGSLIASIPLAGAESGQVHCQRFAMLAEELILTANDDGHHSLPQLPARELRLRRAPRGITVSATDAVVFTEQDEDCVRLNESPLTWPSQLVVRTTLDEAELLRRKLTGQQTPTEMPLTLRAV